MSVKLGQIKKGSCFVTTAGQIRRVLDVTDRGRVPYERRGRRAGTTVWWRVANPPSREKFARDVMMPVPCDYDPDTDPRWGALVAEERQRQISQEKGRRSAGKSANRGRQSKRSNPSARGVRQSRASKRGSCPSQSGTRIGG